MVERAREGDKRAFELLVEKYRRRLSRLLSRMVRDQEEVEDIAQETFIKAYRALPNFRGDAAFYTWLYRIGVNTAKNYLSSRNKAMPTISDQSLGDDDDPDDARPHPPDERSRPRLRDRVECRPGRDPPPDSRRRTPRFRGPATPGSHAGETTPAVPAQCAAAPASMAWR